MGPGSRSQSHPQLGLLQGAGAGPVRAANRGIILRPQQPMAVGAQPHDPTCQLQMEQQQQEQQQQEQQQQQQALLRVRRGAMGAEGEERRGGAQVLVTGAAAPRGHLNCPKL